MSSRRLLVAVLVVAFAGTLVATAVAAKKVTPAGVGAVQLGETYSELREKGLVGKIRHGCELGGPNTRSAPLKAPLKGSVNFTLSAPRKVTDITVSGGAKARGVGIGDTIPEIKDAFPKAKVDHGTDDTFGITLVKIPKNGGGPLRFAVDTTTHKTTLIGVPFIAFCE